jgi:tetratricopeptide (TPR) repeat protein
MNKLQNFPTTYYMSLEESVDRQKNLTDQFKQYGISPVPIISKRFSESDDKVTGKYLHQLNDGTKGCAISHLKAIKEWYETTDEDYAFFCEDDLSLETVKYWDFTWEEFIDSLPEDAECVQLLTIRNDFGTFSIRDRLWNDWGATAYIITRDYAKKLIDTYIKDNTYHLEILNDDIMPLIENILFTNLGKSYTIPLFVEDIDYESTFSKEQDDDVNDGQKNNHKVAHEIVLKYWKNKMKKYNVVDCFPYFNEKELLELRVNLLKDHVDLFVIIDGNYTHSGNQKDFTCRQVIEELNLPKDKIHLIELDMTDESVGPPTTDYDIRFSSNSKVGSRERFQRDAIKNILDKFDDDTIFIISDCDEIINPNNIKFLSDLVRHNSKIFKIPLVLLEGRADLRVYNKEGGVELWDKSMFMCLKGHLEQTPATHIRNGQNVQIAYASQDNQILIDLGWHFAWMQSSENRVYKFQSFCHANDDLRVLLNKDYTKEEHVEFMKSYFPEEGQISPCGNVDQILKKYPTEDLPKIIWNLPRVKNYLLPEESEIKTNLESLLSKYSLDTENPIHNFNLGVWYENEGHTAPALSYFLRCAERSEEDNLAYEALIRGSYCYDKQGTRDGSAKSLLEQALCLMPKRPEAYFLLSRFAERRQWWQDCYIYADQGLMFADHESHPPLFTDVEYPGKYGLLFEKAVSGYWWGKDKECKEIFLDLRQNYSLSEQYSKVVNENLTKMGMKIPEIKIENNVVDKDFFESEYQNACNNPSDINENLPVLYEIAKECSHVTEFGVRSGLSTRAFLNTNASLRSYDLSIDSHLNSIFKKALELGKDVSYRQADVLNIEIEETDLLFIDTWHQYDQLKQELQIHSKKVKKYIAFHDTHTYGVTGENCSNSSSGEIVTGYIEYPMGLLPAIIEFTIDNPEWQFKVHKTNNNGLTILEKKK